MENRRLIDLDKIKPIDFPSTEMDGLDVVRYLNTLPTVDAVEVVHGRWIEAEDGDGAVCSVCGEDFCNVYLEVERFLYCPNCGAKMDGDWDG